MSRRLPVYLVIDTSWSMRGEPIESVRSGLQMLVDALRTDPHALETAYLSVITFSTTAQQTVPLSDLRGFQMPEYKAGGRTSLGAAINLLCDCREREVRPRTVEQRGDWRPLAFILTDGGPTDATGKAIKRFHKLEWGAAVCCAAGSKAHVDFLRTITPKCVLRLRSASKEAFTEYFRWVTTFITQTSRTIGQYQPGRGAELPPVLPDAGLEMF